MKLSKFRLLDGSSLIESVIAAGTSALFLGSLFAMNVTAMKTVRTAREASAASQVLQQRVESLRIANWHQVTNPDWVRANILNADAAGTSSLKSCSETLTFVPYDSSRVGNTQLVRTGGATEIRSRNSLLLQEKALKIIWTVDYAGGVSGKTFSRQTVAILAKGGVAKW